MKTKHLTHAIAKAISEARGPAFDYEKVISKQIVDKDVAIQDAVGGIVEAIANVLAGFDPEFKRRKFVNRCGQRM